MFSFVYLQLYDMSPDPKRKEFLDDLFSFMQKRGQHLTAASLNVHLCRSYTHGSTANAHPSSCYFQHTATKHPKFWDFGCFFFFCKLKDRV